MREESRNSRNERRYQAEKGKKAYKRDTIIMSCVPALLFLSPLAISVYSNYQESKLMEQYAQQIEESLATSSDAEESDAAEAENEGASEEEEQEGNSEAEVSEDPADANTGTDTDSEPEAETEAE